MMFKILTRAKVLWVLLPLALLATANSNAEPMTFSYTFVGQPKQPFSVGAVLTGTIDGTIDPMNPDIVYVNSFGPVRFIRPGLPIFNYASIDSTEFNTIPSGQMTVMSFSGSILDFRSCPLGFTSFFPPTTTPPFDDCPFAFAPGGGFGISYNFFAAAGGFASAADGTGNTELCSDVEPDGPRGIAGCRATDVPIHAENWSLVRLDPDAHVVEIDLRFAGTLTPSIMHVDPTTGLTVTSALGHSHAKGSPGKAEIRGFGGRATLDPDPVTTCLGSSDGPFIIITIEENPGIFTFEDLSLLYSNGSGTGCFNLMTGLFKAEINIMFIGGRGRFEGATGHAVIVVENDNVSTDGSFVGQTGTIVGWIILP